MHLRPIYFILLVLFATAMGGCTRATVAAGPPPPRTEVVAVAPSARHVWIPGHYAHQGRGYRWVSGHYRVAPRRYHTWVPGHWRQNPRATYG